MSAMATIPFDTLPYELIGEIFLLSVSSVSTINQVCAVWRSISLPLPSLWSTIRIHGPSPRHVSMTKLFLERSKELPLDIAIEHLPASCKDGARTPHEDEHAITEEILTLLIPHLSRWKSVKFSFLHETQHSLLTLPPHSKVPSMILENVSLNLKSWDLENADFLWQIIHSYPSVRRLNWRGYVPESGSQGHASIPWEQLTDIYINFDDVPSSLEILGRCQSAKSLDVSFYYPPCPTGSARVDETKVTLPELESLEISSTSNFYLKTLFENLTLPALKHLSLNLNRTDAPVEEEDITALVGLLKRSACALESFEYSLLETPFDEKHELLGYLSAPELSSLHHLGLSVPSNKTLVSNVVGVLTHQTVGDKPRYLLPHLQGLSIVVTSGLGDDETEEREWGDDEERELEEKMTKMFASRIDYSPSQYREFEFCRV